MHKHVLRGVLAAFLSVGPASAATLATTVSATGSYNGDLAVLNDGFVPADGTAYNAPEQVNFTNAPAEFRFSFGTQVTVDSLLANVDNNDTYTFSFFDGTTLVGLLNIGAGEGSVGNGVETFNRIFAPTLATSVVVSASGGDNLYSIGEVQFGGTAVNAVPEPATWAMMIGGFGLLGAASRRRTRTARVTA